MVSTLDRDPSRERSDAPPDDARGETPDGAAEAVPPVDSEPAEDPRETALVAVAVALPVVGCAVLVGGMFNGLSPRFYAAVGGLAGVALAAAVQRVRRPLAANAAMLIGLFAIGLVLLIPSGVGNLVNVRELTAEAAAAADALRPPVPFLPGWQAIVGWLMGLIGFGSAWIALGLRRPPVGLLIPLPCAALAGISVPESQQVGSGLALLVLFGFGLVLLSAGEAARVPGVNRPTIGAELRRLARATPLLAGVTALLFVLAQTDLLFPAPAIDPAQEPQKPRTVPLSDVEDRVLFEVDSTVSGPWRVGSFDVYDGKDWRLPPLDQNELRDVPRNGVVDGELKRGVRATFTVAGLGGVILPSLPNAVGIRADGPQLAYDKRNGNIRLVRGQVEPGLVYDVVAAALPSVSDLRRVTAPPPTAILRFIDIPPPPPAVADLMARAPTTNRWDRFDFLRSFVLDNVVVTGTGSPKAVTPERVQEMLAGTREASPFEIVAAQAMLARWAGIPSRIGYGFDGGELVSGKLQVRPANGATFVEVYFPGSKWLPVIGTPKLAKPKSGASGDRRIDPNIAPSGDIAVRLSLPVIGPRPSTFADQVRQGMLIALIAALGALVVYLATPVIRKSIVRSRLRSAARANGPRARIALAYSEWRDAATDFGFAHPTDTPLMFLARTVPDEEHHELAWLTTRALWGDLRDSCDAELATFAEELSRVLRRRAAAAQPATLRCLAMVSRLSLRQPYRAEDSDGARQTQDA